MSASFFWLLFWPWPVASSFLQQKKAKVTKQTKEKEESGKRQGKAKAKTKK